MNDILDFFRGYKIEPLDHLINYYLKYESSSWFIFDLENDKCRYICPLIEDITGFKPGNYIDKGIQFFLSEVFHTGDHSGIISKFVPYVINSNRVQVDNGQYFSFRMKHKNDYWLRVNGICAKAFKSTNKSPQYLLGFLNKEHIKPEQTYKTTITLREKEVLQLVGNGFSSKIIADRLNISETTAISHRKNLIQKFKVSNTAELIKEAVKAKYID